MPTENKIVALTCEWLKSQGCNILSTCEGTAKGDDIVAQMPDDSKIYVECKGSTSPRSGQEFSGHYIWSSSAGALFNTIRDIEGKYRAGIFAIALPVSHRSLWSDLRPFCERNNLYMLWLDESGNVEVWQPEASKLFRS